ncbi:MULTISPECIES: bifunctional 3-(3-hydroxy-phenyl)propionate/3-hydroxycinnamic acid hydroxylase MhpA [Streptomyces]|uniref:bifunctional 3-(3-hydroxy-phenyl)propionate/3-hydroxycinnamic acid hydroxylase MhpA n=1 Tax=Streptomyces TaxID=1883 RepID=UPI0004CDAAA5|nr:bifunctional 3-(3-hydroxy-phenyl)propionate/3-hydroxycinnamic acid hydroxylase [Streptomyces sp. NRRL S-623]
MTATPPPTPTVPVAVVGAGPVGLTAAILLSRRGIACEVFERHPGLYPLPRAVHLDDEVMRILQAAGVEKEFTALSRPSLGMQLVDAQHRVLARFPRDRHLSAHGFPQANMFDQPDLERVLRDELARHPTARLYASTEVRGLVMPPPGSGLPVRAELEDLTTGDRRTVHAAAVLGCDGAGSTTREAIGAGTVRLGEPQRWLVVDVRCRVELPAWDGVHQVCDPVAPATYMRIGQDRYRWEFRLPEELADGALADRSRLLALLAPWTGDVPQEHLEVVRTADYVFRAQVTDRWRRDRVLLLGDAAHLTPPFIGQGLGAGLRDAHNLVWKLARVLRGSSSEELLDSYEAERRPHATHLVRTAVLIGRAMTSPHPGTALARKAALAVGQRTEALSRAGLAGLSPSLSGGGLVRRAAVPGRGPRPGDLCPQPPVHTEDGGPALLDDLLGPEFALVTCRRLTPALRRVASALDARVVSLVPQPDAIHVIDPTGRLRAWLRGGAVLLRPDRVVLAAECDARARRAETITASLPAWSPAVASSATA